MNLSSGIFVNGILRLSTLIVAVTLFVVPNENACSDNLNFEDRWNQRLNCGCLFFAEDTIVHDSFHESSETETEPENEDVDVFPIEKAINSVAQKIIEGIVSAPYNRSAVVAYGGSTVDLGTLVRQSVENTNLNVDPYWEYYNSCDQWHVVFNQEPDFSNPRIESKEVQVSIPTEKQTSPEYLINSLRNWYLNLEFILVEQVSMPNNAEPFPVIAGNDNLVCLANLLDFEWHAGSIIWNRVQGRFQLAVRFLAGMEFVSCVGGQLLESSEHSLQH